MVVADDAILRGYKVNGGVATGTDVYNLTRQIASLQQEVATLQQFIQCLKMFGARGLNPGSC
jgi:hypothetical protein